MTDRYLRVLGLSAGAGPMEIRTAFHQMALRYHPDRNPEDAHAAAKFQEALDAYQALQARGAAGAPPATRPMPTATPTEVALGLSLIFGIGVLGARLLAALQRRRLQQE